MLYKGRANGWRYLRVGGRGLCWRQGITLWQKNSSNKCRTPFVCSATPTAPNKPTKTGSNATSSSMANATPRHGRPRNPGLPHPPCWRKERRRLHTESGSQRHPLPLSRSASQGNRTLNCDADGHVGRCVGAPQVSIPANGIIEL